MRRNPDTGAQAKPQWMKSCFNPVQVMDFSADQSGDVNGLTRPPVQALQVGPYSCA